MSRIHLIAARILLGLSAAGFVTTSLIYLLAAFLPDWSDNNLMPTMVPILIAGLFVMMIAINALYLVDPVIAEFLWSRGLFDMDLRRNFHASYLFVRHTPRWARVIQYVAPAWVVVSLYIGADRTLFSGILMYGFYTSILVFYTFMREVELRLSGAFIPPDDPNILF